MVGDVSFFLLSSATSEVFPKNTMDAIVASPSEMVILRRQGTSLDMILFSTDYLLARMPSFLHRKVHDAITGETSSPMSLQDYATLLENGSGNDKASWKQLRGVDIGQLAPEIIPELRLLMCDVLPGGTNCSLQFVTPTARPNMGPYWHVSPSPDPDSEFEISRDNNKLRNNDAKEKKGSQHVIVPLTQAGHGTVDTAVLCTQGTVEVLVTHRQRPCDTDDIIADLSSNNPYSVNPNGLKRQKIVPRRVEKSLQSSSSWRWPTAEQLDHFNYRWQKKSIKSINEGVTSIDDEKEKKCPAFRVAVLQVGDLVHIPKGCCYAIRTASTSHSISSIAGSSSSSSSSSRRYENTNNLEYEKTFACGVVTWHWMFQGLGAASCSLEARTALSFASENRRRKRPSLGITEAAIGHATRAVYAALIAQKEWTSMHDPERANWSSLPNTNPDDNPFHFWIDPAAALLSNISSGDSNCGLLRGMLPFAKEIVDREEYESGRVIAEQKASKNMAAATAVSFTSNVKELATVSKKEVNGIGNSSIEVLEDRSLACNTISDLNSTSVAVCDSWVSPEKSVVDPFSHEGFACNICASEIANTYMHCIGCEFILGADYNICLGCHLQGSPHSKNLKLPSKTAGNLCDDSDLAAVKRSSEKSTGRVLDSQKAHWVPNDDVARASSSIVSGRCTNERAQLLQLASQQIHNNAATSSSPVPPSTGNPSAAGNGDTASRTDEIDIIVLQLPFNHRICVHCRLCAVCACRCHDKFELRCRFEPTEDTVRSN